MIQLHPGDKVAIVSLSQGILGEEFAKHQLELGKQRLRELNLEAVIMPHALDGIDKLAEHPELRAADLIDAFQDPTIKGIICAIGGDDTFRLAPYVFTDEVHKIIQNNPKLFMGYSDTTINHLMLYKLGVNSFYGLSFLTCFAELGEEMLPYSKASFKQLFNDQSFVYHSSPVWYEERTDFSQGALRTERIKHQEKISYNHIQGQKQFSGHLLGGCIESLTELLTGSRYDEEVEINQKYKIFPNLNEWEEAVIFLETSEEKPTPEKFTQMVEVLKDYGIFDHASGVLLGKAQDEVFNEDYAEILVELLPKDLSVVTNVNFGHAYPKMVMQYGAPTFVDMNKKEIRIGRL